ANLVVRVPPGIEMVQTPTARDMATAAEEHRDHDVVIMAAAVADYRPSDPIDGKRAKGESAWTVELEPTLDILRELGARRRSGQILVGFAADTGDAGLGRAREKLETKRADLIVFNDVEREGVGFEAADNEV